MRWAIPGLNTRETALVVWVGGFLLFSLTKRDVRSSIGGMFKLVFTSVFLGGVIFGAAAYTAVTILLLRHLGYWEPDMTKVAVLWFVGFALVALFNTKNVDASYFHRLVLHNLGLAVVVEFVANLHTFPLPVELLLVPMAFLLVGTQAYAESNPAFASARTLSAWCLGILGAVSLSYSISYLVSHFDEVATAGKIKEFVLPLVLTACFLPFLVAVRYLTVWQTMLHMIRFGLQDNLRLYRFTRRSIIQACGINLGKAQLFESEFRGRLWGATTEPEVTRIVDDFREAWARRRRVHVEPGEQSDF